ncbi:two-component system histidine kinase PnpS [Sporosarcina sp. Te-1]|uniref:two-component system histidine kinase PnpS n=1 Tax=Sporosarcina sp. Te-1 TaxID=2818390 RepID=UPI001A9FBE5B|nr:ATP-binding protein [Sporosarcina sp. Te-1]QTD41443.1 PAS domain S-box protein [Sporosarcina sp. Te-1]
MKSLHTRLVVANAVMLFILLTGLGLVLGQFFQFFPREVHEVHEEKYILFLVIVLSIAGLLYFFVSYRVFRQYSKSIDQASATAVRIAGGDYLARTPIAEQETNNVLGISINQIARNLQEVSILRSMEKERLKTLVESMGSGLLMFGREGSVNLLNGVFEKTFGVTSAEVIGKTFKEIELPADIKDLIEDVFMTEQAHEKHVRIDNGHAVYHLSVYGAPVIGRHGNWLGIIIVMHNITELIRLEEVRKDFVANVSHELRTPITSIKGFAETLLDGALESPEVAREFLGIVLKESDRLKLLVDDLLELSGIEQEGFQISLQPIELSSVMEDAIKIVSGAMERKRMTVQLQNEAGLKVLADRDRFIQVMVNLLTNAVNYSKEETTITVAAEKRENEVIIQVKDQGIGISPVELPRLFERFYRVDRARSRESGGTGLGLAIVKHLIEAHHGYVTVHSEVGVGTTFTIHLPPLQ